MIFARHRASVRWLRTIEALVWRVRGQSQLALGNHFRSAYR